MLSVLIPVYNFDITSLVNSLSTQCEERKTPYEIFCLDDASSNRFHEINKSVSFLPNVLYKRLEKNLGRSRIRNIMAQEAKYENLLFMDCDSEVVTNDFIRTYIQYCNSDQLICGGRIYSNVAPADEKKILRWNWGRRSEEIASSVRNKNPYNSFMTNNFLIRKKIFLEILLDESLSGYGHEDTLFGFHLKRKSIPIIHIDNPLRHIGLEDAEEFLSKTENGISNLLLISREKKLSDKELNEIPLMRTYFLLGSMLSQNIFLFFFQWKRESLKKNLLSSNPSLRWFDIFKLGVLIEKAKS